MIDPEENKPATSKEEQNSSADATENTESSSNFDEHMQIDEEGNEITEDDV